MKGDNVKKDLEYNESKYGVKLVNGEKLPISKKYYEVIVYQKSMDTIKVIYPKAIVTIPRQSILFVYETLDNLNVKIE